MRDSCSSKGPYLTKCALCRNWARMLAQRCALACWDGEQQQSSGQAVSPCICMCVRQAMRSAVVVAAVSVQDRGMCVQLTVCIVAHTPYLPLLLR
jgi:hypothetical protein